MRPLLRLLLPGLAIASSLSLATSALAAPGDLDATFGTGGIVLTDFGAEAVGNAVALAPDGKSVAAGTTEGDFAMARYNRVDGRLDLGFDADGRVSMDLGATDEANDVAVQPDGKTLVVGTTGTDGQAGDMAVVRLNVDGSPDPTFAGAGVLVLDLGGDDAANAVALDSVGRILVGGRTGSVGGPWKFAVVRLTTAGNLDPTFAQDGSATTQLAINDYVFSLAIQPNGAIVATGFSYDGSVNIGVVRYTPAGRLDRSFGRRGKVISNIGGADRALDVVVQPDGKIVVAGKDEFDGVADFILLRYLSDGTFDPAFGNGGIVNTVFPGTAGGAEAVVLQSDGKLVAVGSATTADRNFALARYKPDGSLDGTFGNGGMVVTDLAGDNYANDVVLQSTGKIVLAGTYQPQDDFALARYQS